MIKLHGEANRELVKGSSVHRSAAKKALVVVGSSCQLSSQRHRIHRSHKRKALSCVSTDHPRAKHNFFHEVMSEMKNIGHENEACQKCWSTIVFNPANYDRIKCKHKSHPFDVRDYPCPSRILQV